MKKHILILVLVLALTLLSACSVISIKAGRGVVPFLVPTQGATVEKDGTIKLNTSVEDNRFSFVVLQLWTDAPEKYIEDITSSVEGTNDGVYVHEQETGTYVLRLKGNSNKQDESVGLRVYLVKGESYVYSYNVTSFGEKAITIQDFILEIK